MGISLIQTTTLLYSQGCLGNGTTHSEQVFLPQLIEPRQSPTDMSRGQPKLLSLIETPFPGNGRSYSDKLSRGVYSWKHKHSAFSFHKLNYQSLISPGDRSIILFNSVFSKPTEISLKDWVCSFMVDALSVSRPQTQSLVPNPNPKLADLLV